MKKSGVLPVQHTRVSRMLFFFYSILFVFQIWSAILFLQHGWNAISYPYQLDYGEGAVLDQVVHLSNSQPIYRTDLSTPPYVVNVYPPLYLVAQLPFIIIWGPAFWYGRVISLLSALVTAILITFTLYELVHHWAGSILGGLTFMSIPYIGYWASLFRVDTLALCFSWGALFVIVRWPKAHWSLLVSVLFLILSVYTRQSYLLTAPLTIFCWLVVQSGWKRAFSFFVLFITLVVGIFLVLNLATDTGFFFNTITILGKQTISFPGLWYFAQIVSNHLPFLLLAASVSVGLALKGAFESHTKVFIVPYLVGSFISALTIGKPGSNVNYLLEFSAILSFSTVIVIVWLKHWPWLQMLALILLTLQTYIMVQSTDTALPHSESPQIMQLIRQADGPVLTDEYTGLLLLDHRPVYIQPFDFFVMAKNGLWNQQPFLNMLDRREFELIIIYRPYDYLVEQRWTEQMLEHIKLNYQQVDMIANNEIYKRRP